MMVWVLAACFWEQINVNFEIVPDNNMGGGGNPPLKYMLHVLHAP
jgi:hypothetical protein